MEGWPLFASWSLYFILASAVVTVGLVMAVRGSTDAQSPQQKVALERTARGIGVTLSVALSALLVIIGVAALTYVTLQYWKVLIWLPLLGGGGGTVVRYERGKAGRKKAKKKHKPRKKGKGRHPPSYPSA